MQVSESTQDLVYVPVSSIRVQEGFNPRTYFDDAAQDQLTESVKQQGVLQSLLLRPDPSGDGYLLVAGERRLRASRAAKLDMVPAIVREMDEREALERALAENSKRANISVGEESEAARRALDLCAGDEAEAAKRLGWSVHILRSRLLLLNAAQSVLDALARNQIKLGHAELLATLEESVQQKVLANVIEKKASVADLKEQLKGFSQELAHAPFDTSGCNGCPHNSTTQASLFDTHVGEGRCANRSCWGEKVEAHVLKQRKEAESTFNVVWLEREKDPTSCRRLVAKGVGGVGPEQFEACKGCASFGALVRTKVGKEGQIEGGVCFDTDCNTKLAAAFAKSQAPETVAAADSKTGHAAKAEKSATKGAAAKSAPKTQAKAKEVPAGTETLINQWIRRVGAREVAQSHALRERVMLSAVLGCLSQIDAGEDVKAVVQRHGLSVTHAPVAELLPLPDDAIAEIRDVAVAALFGDKDDARLPGGGNATHAAHIVKHQKVDIAACWRLDKEYLKTLTKSGIEAVLREAGFVNSMPGDEKEREKAFRALVSGKRDALIEAATDGRHDFTGFVPSAVHQVLDARIAKKLRAS